MGKNVSLGRRSMVQIHGEARLNKGEDGEIGNKRFRR
jgi:hypothetical protein